MGGSIDPIEYDVAELRELARVRGDRYVADGFLWTELPESFSPADTAEYDRPATWTGSLEERQKPYLRELPDEGDGQRIAREWVEGLVRRAGSDAAVEALAYYESLGWLTEAVREELEGYLLAVGYRSGGSIVDLTRADHVESLARTARLAAVAGSGTENGAGWTAEGDREWEGTVTDRDGTERDGGSGGASSETGGRESEPSAGGTPADTVADEGDSVDAEAWWGEAVADAGGPADDGDDSADDSPGDDGDDSTDDGSGDDRDDSADADSGFEFGTRTE